MMPFMGVRISWLMFARNSVLCRLTDSACNFARCNSTINSPRRKYCETATHPNTSIVDRLNPASRRNVLLRYQRFETVKLTDGGCGSMLALRSIERTWNRCDPAGRSRNVTDAAD